jgi:hypothetical protein
VGTADDRPKFRKSDGRRHPQDQRFLAAFSFFAARFSALLFAGFFFVSFFRSIPFDMVRSLDEQLLNLVVTLEGRNRNDSLRDGAKGRGYSSGAARASV